MNPSKLTKTIQEGVERYGTSPIQWYEPIVAVCPTCLTRQDHFRFSSYKQVMLICQRCQTLHGAYGQVMNEQLNNNQEQTTPELPFEYSNL